MRLHGYTPPAVIADAGPEVSTLAMLAVYPTPEQAEALAIDGGLEPADLHCTLVFLGEAADIDADTVNEVAAEVAGQLAALEGTIGGAGAFAEGPDGVPIILLPDVKGLTALREQLVTALGARGIESPSEHGFLPHMTLTYDSDLQPTDPDVSSRLGTEVTFGQVSVVVAGERTDHQLDGGFTAALVRHVTERIHLPGDSSARPISAAGMYTTGTPEEISAATARASERMQNDEHVDPLAAAYREVLERAANRMRRALTSRAVVLADADQQFVPPDADEVIDTDAIAADVADVIADAQRQAARLVVAELDQEGITYDVDTVFTDELLARIGEVATTSIEAEMRDQYRFTLEVAAEQGWSVADTADALGNKIADVAPHTARAMARTDLNGLANGGSLHVAQKALATHEQPVYKTWLATPDERTRESHLNADGQTVPINENFHVGFSSMPYPGYPFAAFEEVINCRCTITYTSDPTGQAQVVTDPDAKPEPVVDKGPLAHIEPSRTQLEMAEEAWEGRYAEDLAGEHNLTIDDYRRQLEQKLRAELADVDVRIRTPADVALAVAEDGRFKTQFETTSSGGIFAPDMRRRTEKNLFGIPEHYSGASDRPVYGYLGGVNAEGGALTSYGDVTWVLKAEVRERTTWTSMDSLNATVAPSPLTRPSVLSVYPPVSPRGFTHLQKPLREWQTDYFEAQVHGGVSLDDVDRVEIFYPPDEPGFAYSEFAQEDAERLRQALAGRNIEVVAKPYPSDYLDSLNAGGHVLPSGLSVGDDSGQVEAVGGLVPVAASDDAEHGQLAVEDAGPLVEHPAGGVVEAVAPAAGQHQEGVVAALRENLHDRDLSAPAGGSQPSERLPSTHAIEEAPMSTTTPAVQADGNGEIALNPIGWDAVLATEEHPTEDGRLLVAGSISWRDLPLSLMGMLETSEYGHVGAKVAGRIDSISRVAHDLVSTGELTSAFGVNELAPLIADKTVRGVSVDLAVLDWEYRDRETGATLDEDDLFVYWLEGKEEQILFAVLDGVIVGATVCPMPAISNAEISLAASAGLDQAGRAILADALGDRRGALADVPLIRVFTPFDQPRQSGRQLVAAAPLVELAPATRAHFERTEFPGKTPLTVGDPDEHGWRPVFGHIATWDTCHVGIPGVCTTAPRSHTTPAYALFHQAQYLTAEGDTIDVGSLMLGTGHAGLSASRAEATRHYDKPDMVGARVRAYDGEFGIWVAGVARAELTDAGLRELRENPPSGDWRSYNGHLELVAVCAVAVPGFPVVADAQANITAAGGEVGLTALIASSGTITPTDAVKDAMIAAGCACEDVATADEALDDLADLALS